MKKWLTDIFFSFPVQLLILHFRNNLLLILTWGLLALLMTGNLGAMFGVKYLFLAPEYLGEVNFLSFFYLGLAFGGFFMTWNLTTYLLDAYHFPFLASLARPFTKFCLNNLIVPIAFIGTYLLYTIQFQSYYEFWEPWVIFQHITGFLFGLGTLVAFAAIYFTYTNKDISSLAEMADEEEEKDVRTIVLARREDRLQSLQAGKPSWRVDTYLNESLRPRLVRSVAHYDLKLLLRVFRQNHVNALIVQLSALLLLIVLGLLIDNSYFRIPAGASIFILSSVFVAISGAITYWFDRWRVTVFILILFAINFLTSYDIFNHKNRAYGMDYTSSYANYSYADLELALDPDLIERDKAHTIEILDRWLLGRRKAGENKPKMAIFCVSGGGMKAAVWSMQVLQRSDSIMQGELFDNAVLITGASGGMIGTAYLRELKLQTRKGSPINMYDRRYIDNISRDLLNSLAFTIVANDLFMPWLEFETQGYRYRKDRGYIFEDQLNENTENALKKSIADYREDEDMALIPMLFVTPSIVNDGRRLVISPQGVSYMSIAPVGLKGQHALEIDAIDYGHFFREQKPYNLLFTSALRMNATYPYILPNVYMPSQPEMEVMDAGFLDNYGIMSATRFIHVFKDWILENTSGVVLVQISSQDKFKEIAPNANQGMIETLLNPLGIAGQVMSLQDYEHDNNIGLMYDLLGEDYFDIVRFIYKPGENTEKASMTFHLTQREKASILESFYLPENQESLGHLLEVMGKKPVQVMQ
ncbi:MAG: patatin-like phospholipase family protein [Bacteroidota bacterium]